MSSKYRYLKLLVSSVLVGMIGFFAMAQQYVLAQEVIQIGILQYVEHDSLSQNRQGFIDGLEEAGYVDGENIEINYLNAAADTANLQTMSETLANQSDYLFAIATPAAQSLANVEKEKPVYFSSVSDAVGAGLVESLEAPGGNLTGTVDAGPIAEQAQLLQAVVPDAQTIGLIYNSGEANSVSEASLAKEALEGLGLEVVEGTVTSTNDIAQVLESLVDEVDALFTVTDNTIASAMALVGEIAVEADLALIGGSKDMILENGLATYGLDYYELGKQTARMVVRQIEEGLETSEIPVERAEYLELVINESNAEALGIDPDSIELPEDAESSEESSEEDSE